MVSREWTDAVLPLTMSLPCELTRVMVGRIELMTPTHRKLIAQSPNDPKAYQALGRFGYAMVLDELALFPTPALTKFAKLNDIRAFTPPVPAAARAATQPVARVSVAH
jgi:hypothetical protein